MAARLRRPELPARAEETHPPALVPCAGRADAVMAASHDDFFSRWSRRKRAAAQRVAPAPLSPPQALPQPESLTFDSDFGRFMHAKVEENVKRAALRKLFADPRFNVMDGLDIYIGDYSVEDPIPAAMLAGLEHARQTLFAPAVDDHQSPAALARKEAGEPDAAS
ncbi:MAG: DUF3306 domain-containing protein [Betaproteobacteria bacterium]